MRIAKRQLRRIIKEWTGQGMSLFELGQEDAVREIPAQDPDPEYMRGYNEVLLEFGEDPVEPPARHRSPRGRSVREAVGYYSDEDMPEAWHAGYDDALNGDNPLSADPDYEDGYEAGVVDSQNAIVRNAERGYR